VLDSSVLVPGRIAIFYLSCPTKPMLSSGSQNCVFKRRDDPIRRVNAHQSSPVTGFPTRDNARNKIIRKSSVLTQERNKVKLEISEDDPMAKMVPKENTAANPNERSMSRNQKNMALQMSCLNGTM
jgi:hypothetical protein